MKYKVSDLAKIFDVSTETIRHYEKIGLIQSTRCDENNYRLFDDWAIFDLSDYLTYKRLGFTFNESKNILKGEPSSELTDLLNNKIIELRQMIHEKTLLLDWMEWRLNDIKNSTLNLNQIIFQYFPPMYLVPTEGSVGDLLQGYQPSLDRIKKYESLSPLTIPFLKTNFQRLLGDDSTIERGVLIFQKYVDALELDLPDGVEYLPQSAYLTYTIEIDNLNNLPQLVKSLLQYVELNNLKLDSNIYGHFLARFHSESNYHRYIRFMVSIEEN